MFELSGSRLYQQKPPWELSGSTDCMIAPIEHRQHEFLPASLNPCRVSADLGLHEFGFSGLLERGLTTDGNGSIQKSFPRNQASLPQNQYPGERSPLFPAQINEKPTSREQPSAQQKKFLIFNRSGFETKLIYSSLHPRAENLTTPLGPAWNPPEKSGCVYHHYVADKQGIIAEQAWTRTPALCEESGENEIIDEVDEMREDSQEINALLYSEDYDDHDDCDSEEDDEVSSGHSPLARNRESEKPEDQSQEVENDLDTEGASSTRSSKRQKNHHGEYNNRLQQGLAYEGVRDFIGALDEGVCPSVGNKRDRKDKIHDTLRVLERLIPGLKSKDPLIILDKAIDYLKCLKYNAESVPTEDLDSSSSSSSSFEALN